MCACAFSGLLSSTRKSIALPLPTFTALPLELKVTSPSGSVRPEWRIVSSPNPYAPQAFTEKSQNACGCALLSIVTLAWIPQILVYIGQHAVAGIFPHDLRSHHDWLTFAIGNLVASDFNFIVGNLAGAWLR